MHVRRTGATLLVLGCLAPGLVASAASGDSGGTGVGSDGNGGGATTKGAMNRHGMWIWYVSQSSGGSIAKIATKAKRNHIGTVFVKSGDGSGAWSQFSSGLVSALHARGLKVCGWQYVYGTHPVAEAKAGAKAEKVGADCMVIDAESEYEGRYAAADKYMTKLRALVGKTYPVGLAGFPYVDYHPGFPYSVFLGPGGAQYNLPQLYWHAIGTSVKTGYAHTYSYNRIYRRPIRPLGQTYDSPPRKQIASFRRVGLSYGATAVSWWSWQETNGSEWTTIRKKVKKAPIHPSHKLATIKRGSHGDLVIWLQEHLRGSGAKKLKVSGSFGAGTETAVRKFQRDHDLKADGVVGTTTWKALLAVKPIMVDWGKNGTSASASSADGATAPRAPQSASLPARRYEIPAPSARIGG